MHRPVGGEVSTLPSTVATEPSRTSCYLKGGNSGGVSMLARLRRNLSPSCEKPRGGHCRVLVQDFGMICGRCGRIEWKIERENAVKSCFSISVFTCSPSSRFRRTRVSLKKSLHRFLQRFVFANRARNITYRGHQKYMNIVQYLL